MSKETRMKILEMLKDGTISVEEAEKLLKAVDGDSFEVVATKKHLKMLKIEIDSNSGDKVRVQIPLEFAKLLKTDMFKAKLGKNSDEIDIDAILELIDSDAMGEIVNITSENGDTVRIFVE